jgi:hypothetical protein
MFNYIALSGNTQYPFQVDSGCTVVSQFDDIVSTGASITSGTGVFKCVNSITDGSLKATGTGLFGTLLAGAGSITDSSGAISFGNENLLTTGTLGAGTLTHTGRKEKYRLITSADSAVATDDFIAVTGTTTVTLPTAVGIQGTVYTIKNTGTAIVTIATTSSQTIDGVTTYVIRTTNSGVQIISDNANWLIKAVF